MLYLSCLFFKRAISFLWLTAVDNLALGYAIRRVQVKQEDLKLNGACQHLVCADVHAIYKNTVAVLIAYMEINLEVNAGKNKVQ
jgi:hypothetical protein